MKKQTLPRATSPFGLWWRRGWVVELQDRDAVVEVGGEQWTLEDMAPMLTLGQNITVRYDAELDAFAVRDPPEFGIS